MSAAKYVYLFGGGKADGNEKMKNLLGGKGANLAEMCSSAIPGSRGFHGHHGDAARRISQNNGKLPAELDPQVTAAMAKTEAIMGMKYGDPNNPLLVSCRSGARKSMPGMMDTVLNVGLCTATIPGMIKKTNNPAFRVGFLPPPDHDVRRRRHGEGGGDGAGGRQGHPQDHG